MVAPHTATVERLAEIWDTDPIAGLGEDESAKRLDRHGPNEIPREGLVSGWRILLSQLRNVLVLILFVAIALSLLLGHAVEAVVIAVIAVVSILLGFTQEYRAERALEALRRLAAPGATVVRGGRVRDIPAREVVPGDVMILSTGDVVPADGRLVEAASLQTDEAALTGESLPVGKQTDPLPSDAIPLGDRTNMVFASCAVTCGRGRAIVVATGTGTEVGKIGALLRTVDASRTPLEVNLRRTGQALGWSAGGIVLVVAALGLLQGRPFLDMVFFGIALAVAVVPEALPAVVTISLALGARRMAKRNALIRRLPAVEALGSVTIVCSDKTGTLTTGEMTVRELYVAGNLVHVTGTGYEPRGASRELLEAAALSTDAQLVEDVGAGRWKVRGDPTEGAILAVAAKAGLWKPELEARRPRIAEIPFSSERKRMTTVHLGAEGRLAISKGAAEVILASCTRKRTAVGDTPLHDDDRESYLSAALAMGERGMRVLAVARSFGTDLAGAERGMTILGLIGMLDPPRPEARAAIASAFAAGIRPVMITGDHPVTARAIAAELGLLRGGAVVTGFELDGMSDAELERHVDRIDVYARVSPAHKLRVVAALARRGQVSAMTGDGVNDAPALKKADVGIAMGITGTDVAKGAAAVILTDDNFASIIAAVEEGRAIYDNVKKYLMYLLSSNVGEIALMTAAMACGLPLPLTAVQILYVNLATDGLPALALAVDPPAPDLMRRRPRRVGGGIFTRPVTLLILLGGAWSALVNLALFAWAIESGRPLTEAVTMTFVSLVLIEFFKAYCFRSDRRSIVDHPFANRWLDAAISWELVLLALVLYVPRLSAAFGTYPLPWMDWIILVPIAFTIVPTLEFAKWLGRRGYLGGSSS
jgi:Ca2+-transporting ATPase